MHRLLSFRSAARLSVVLSAALAPLGMPGAPSHLLDGASLAGSQDPRLESAHEVPAGDTRRDSLYSLEALSAAIHLREMQGDSVVPVVLTLADSQRVHITGYPRAVEVLLLTHEDTTPLPFLEHFRGGRVTVAVQTGAAGRYRIVTTLGTYGQDTTMNGRGLRVKPVTLDSAVFLFASAESCGANQCFVDAAVPYAFASDTTLVPVPVEKPRLDTPAGRQRLRRLIPSLPAVLNRFSDSGVRLFDNDTTHFWAETFNRGNDHHRFNDGEIMGTYRLVGGFRPSPDHRTMRPDFRLVIATARYVRAPKN